MKITFAIAVFLLSATAFSATKSFDVKAKVSLNGKLVSTPHLVTLPNELASISEVDKNKNEMKIELVASDYSNEKTKDGILMNFTVSYLKNGKQTIVARPKIVALPGETATISVGNRGDVDALELKVVATRNL